MDTLEQRYKLDYPEETMEELYTKLKGDKILLKMMKILTISHLCIRDRFLYCMEI